MITEQDKERAARQMVDEACANGKQRDLCGDLAISKEDEQKMVRMFMSIKESDYRDWYNAMVVRMLHFREADVVERAMKGVEA